MTGESLKELLNHYSFIFDQGYLTAFDKYLVLLRFLYDRSIYQCLSEWEKVAIH